MASWVLLLLALGAAVWLFTRTRDLRDYPEMAEPCCNGTGKRTKWILHWGRPRLVRGPCPRCKGDAWRLRPGARTVDT